MPSESSAVGPTASVASSPSKCLWLELHEAAFVLQMCEDDARLEIEAGGLERSTMHDTLRIGVDSLERLLARRIQDGVQSELAAWALRAIAQGKVASPRPGFARDAPEPLINVVAPIAHGRAARQPDASNRVASPHLSYYGEEHFGG